MLYYYFYKKMALLMTSLESEWQTTAKKTKKQNKSNYSDKPIDRQSYKKKTNVVWKEGITHFVPKSIKDEVINIMKKCSNARDFMKEIKLKVKTSSNIWESTLVYILHEASSCDKLEIIEFILDSSTNRTKLVNSKCGPKEFTPIFKSAYKGSIRALKMLCIAGADKTIINKIGETVMEALEQGNIDMNNRSPSVKIFTNDRFSECRHFLSNWDPDRIKDRVIDKDFVAYIPPNKRTDEDEVEVDKIIDDESEVGKIIDEVIDDESFTDLNINEFIEVYKSARDINRYITTTLSPNDTLVEICIGAAEKSNEIFDELMANISELTDDIITVLINDENILDYAKYDAPFTKKKLNELRVKYLFDLIE